VKVVDVADWFTRGTYEVNAPDSSCPYYGIAIGPDSDEGLVVVNGVTLQAGKVLPIKAARYTVTNVRPSYDPNGGAGGRGVNRSELALFKQLQLVVLESPAELALASWGRANREYSSGLLDPTEAQSIFGTFMVPFVGRKRCRFQLTFNGFDAGAPGVPINYLVTGWRWAPTERTFNESVLATVSNVTSDAEGTIAFYIENELWDVLKLFVWYSSAPGSADAWFNATTSGESGDS